MPTISQLSDASTDELDAGFDLVISTTEGKTRKADISDVKSRQFCQIKCASVTIPSAEVLTLNTTPVQLIPAQGAGTIIDVVSASGHIDFNTTSYATNVDLEIIASGATSGQFDSSVFINSAINKYEKFMPTDVGIISNHNMMENADVNVKVRAGDPTAGDSDITIYALYRVITL